MKRLMTLSIVFLLAASALATTASKASSLVCEKTGVVVDSCCCVVQDGQMICTLTGEVVTSCCCTPAADACGHRVRSTGGRALRQRLAKAFARNGPLRWGSCPARWRPRDA